MTEKSYEILAPISGKTVNITTVPDPVFAEKLTGDGLAILCESDTVLAPCDGTISLFFDTKHAFAITTPEGVQILVHIGLDTVLMNGEGIKALHQAGEVVKAGTPILQLDLPLLEKKHINLLSPILIVNEEKVRNLSIAPADQTAIAQETALLRYTL